MSDIERIRERHAGGYETPTASVRCVRSSYACWSDIGVLLAERDVLLSIVRDLAAQEPVVLVEGMGEMGYVCGCCDKAGPSSVSGPVGSPDHDPDACPYARARAFLASQETQ